jgi:hypothetical protein
VEREAKRQGMNLHDIKAAADRAETAPGSGMLNWGRLSFRALAAWVEYYNWCQPPDGPYGRTEDMDVDTARRAFEAWWKGGGK